jgi:hypothetical protein
MLPNRCDAEVIQYVSRGFSTKEVKSRCGTTGQHGDTLLCDECTDGLSKRYPQGWLHTPGDTCVHGTYLGCHEDNDEVLCPQCELGDD